MIGKVQGGGMTGIPSNIGVIKAYYEKHTLSLSKGTTKIPLNFPFSLERIVGAIVYYEGYICSQAMMSENGDYAANYGLSFRVNYTSKELWVTASGSYPERNLDIIIFYI